MRGLLPLCPSVAIVVRSLDPTLTHLPAPSLSCKLLLPPCGAFYSIIA